VKTVSEIIATQQERIIIDWIREVGGSRFARGLTRRELASTIPAYLASLGRCDEAGPVQLGSAQEQLIDRHLSNRVRQGYSLDGILGELALLGHALSVALDGGGADERPSGTDVARVYAELYLTSVAATSLFSEQQLEEDHVRLRNDRLLRQVVAATPATYDDPLSVRGRLADFLDVVMTVMGARAAALRLHDADTERVMLSASAGEPGDELEQYVAGFDARVTGTTQLEVSEALHQRDVHSLLGLRIAARHHLRGVLYVGIRDRRGFTAAEVTRLEAVSRTLPTLLDATRLQAALHERAGEIEVEHDIRERIASVLEQDLAVSLTVAEQSAGAIRAHIGGDDQRRAAAVISELDRMRGLIAELVDMHRIRAGHPLELDVRECDLRDVAADAVAELPGREGDRVTQQAAGRVTGRWDPDRLRRAIRALLLDALERSGRHGAVRLTVTRTVKGAEAVIHDSATTPPRDCDLAMLLAGGYIDAHGGCVTIDRDAERGSTVRLTVPLRCDPIVT
jgi:signal transduction histidine kinase